MMWIWAESLYSPSKVAAKKNAKKKKRLREEGCVSAPRSLTSVNQFV